jgi:hypothetical protein
VREGQVDGRLPSPLLFPLLLRLGRVLAHPAQHAMVGLMNARSTAVYLSEIAAADM